MASSLLFRRRKSTHRPLRPLVEALERRELLASFTTLEDTTLVISDPALANAIVISGPNHGKVVPTNAGGFAYTPAENYNGQDAFVYGFASNTAGTTVTGKETAAITIKSVNDPPAGTDQTRQITANNSYALQPWDFGFTDPKDNPKNNFKAVQIVTLPTSGKLFHGDNAVVSGQFIPVSDFSTIDSTGKSTPTNKIRFTPDATSNDLFPSLTFAVQDEGGTENGGVDLDQTPNKLTIAIVIPPVARPDSYEVAQNGSLTVAAPGVLGNDTGVNGRSLTASLVTEKGPQHGTVEVHSDGSFTYKPADKYWGTDTFTYRATDNSPAANPLPAASATATVTINVRATGPIVAANNDQYFAIQNSPLTIVAPGVLKNDVVFSSDPTLGSTNGTVLNLPLLAEVVSGVSHGTLQLAADGSFQYMPAKNYFGADTFTYRATIAPTASGETIKPNPTSHDVATVTIYVNPPAAANDIYTTAPDTALAVSAPGVLSNDHGAEGHKISALLVSGTTHGDLTLNFDGSFSYKPADKYTGTDTFVYRAIDSTTVPPGDSNGGTTTSATASGGDNTTTNGGLATVTIYVKTIVPPPIAFDDDYTTSQGTVLRINAPGVMKNDFKPEGAASLLAIINSWPSKGDLTFKSDGSFTYAPKNDFTGDDTFTYLVAELLSDPSPPLGDPNQWASNIATVTIHVKPVNTTPVVVAVNDSFDGTAGKPLEVSLPGVLKNDYVTSQDPTAGSGSNNSGGTVTQPSFPLSAVILTQPGSGTVELHSDGSFRYVPKDNFTGPDTFTYRAVLNTTTTPGGPSSTNDPPHDVATVTINVKPAIVPPVAKNDEYHINQDSSLAIDPPGVLANDVGPAGHKLITVLNSGVSHGTLNLTDAGGFSYTPEKGYSGSDSFTYYAVDTSAVTGTNAGIKSNVATVTIFIKKPEPPPGPVAVNDFYLTAENTPLGIGIPGVLANDYFRPANTTTPPTKPQLTAMLIAGPTNGSVTLNGDGSFNYVPKIDFVGTDTFTYQDSAPPPSIDANGNLTDGSPILSNIATVTIKVVAAIAHNDSYVTDQNTALDVAPAGVLANDAGGSTTHPLVSTLLTGPTHGTLSLAADGSFHYEPAKGYFGSDLFTYRASDGTAPTDPATGAPGASSASNITSNAIDVGLVKIYVRPPATSIEAHDDKFLTRQNTALTIDSPGVLANDFGPVNVPVVAAVVDKPTHGTIVLDAKGGFTYTPEENYSGEDKFTYSASVATAAGSTIKGGMATVTIYVAAPDSVPPTVIIGGDQRTTDESGPQRITDWAAVVGVDSNGAPLPITVISDKPNLFTSPPTIDAAGQLVFTPAPNASGTATITVSVSDPATGNVDNTATFTIHIDKPHVFSNTADPCDVNDDRTIAADDVISIINYINAHGSTQTGEVPANLLKHLFYDVDKDNWIAAIDVVTIINHINAHPQDSSPAASVTDIDPALLSLVAQDAADAVTGKKKT